MPNQRAAGQKQIITLMDRNFLLEIEAGMTRAGYSDRSKFIRDAVFEKLQRLGIRCNYILAMAPSRVGKGGVKPEALFRRTSPDGPHIHLNEKPPAYKAKKGLPAKKL
jgi:hypothetical protein